MGNITSKTKLETLKSTIDFTGKAVNNDSIDTVVLSEKRKKSSNRTDESNELKKKKDIGDDRLPEVRLRSAENRLLEYKDRNKIERREIRNNTKEIEINNEIIPKEQEYLSPESQDV